ncbi:solute carrier family 23 member 2-like isoform X2 [Planococcus citri]|uniref:solute carrier family 23 member 2-like isoform X2 n=1 Tax=Planococcus citri TaxID=170843 RepID=UPI0031FA3F59
MNEILMEQTDFLKDDHQKVNFYALETNKSGLLSQIATVVQNVLNNFGSILITLYLLSPSFCMLREDVSRSYLISALFIGTGICALVVTLCSNKFTVTGSNRLGYLVCLLMLFERKRCDAAGDIYAMGPDMRTAEWLQKLNEIQGGVIITCIVQLFFGLIDMNFLVKFIRPVSIAPTMILIGLFVTKTSAMRMASSSPFLFVITIGLMFCVHSVVYNCSDEKQKSVKLRNKLYVGAICVIVMWSLCAVLSTFELLWMHSAARTDIYTGVYNYISMFRCSFPFQWGIPEWKSESIFPVLPAAFITVFEILANFHNRQKKTSETDELQTTSMLIKLEAILCLVMNSMGVVIGLNVGVKKDGRKLTDICTATVLIAVAFSGSLCAFFTMIPEPIVGALIFMTFLSAILEGFDMLKFIDLKLAKNIYVLGISLFMAFVRKLPIIYLITFNC